MELRLIRNATLSLDYAGRRLLTDPFLAPRHSLPSFTGRSSNPLVELPVPAAAVLAGAELTIVSHRHADHFDPLAQELLPKATPIVCQPGDADAIRRLGFADVTPLTGELTWRGITFAPVPGAHGSGDVLAEMGPTMGVILRAPGEPTLYWTGDTVLTPTLLDAIERHRPDVIVTHSAGAVWGAGTLIVMDAAQTIAVCRAAPAAVVVAVHLEALDHGTVSRADLRAAARATGITDDRLRIPAVGEALRLVRPDHRPGDAATQARA